MDTKRNQSKLRFTNPLLQEAIFMTNPDFKGNLAEVGTLPLKIDVKSTQPVTDEKGVSSATVLESVSTASNATLKEDQPVFLRVTMLAQFAWKSEEASKELADSFLEVSAPSLLMSYIRTTVTTLTEQSEIHTQHIPFIDFTQMKHDVSDAGNVED